MTIAFSLIRNIWCQQCLSGCVHMHAEQGLIEVFGTAYVYNPGFVDSENVVQELAESNMRQGVRDSKFRLTPC